MATACVSTICTLFLAIMCLRIVLREVNVALQCFVFNVRSNLIFFASVCPLLIVWQCRQLSLRDARTLLRDSLTGHAGLFDGTRFSCPCVPCVNWLIVFLLDGRGTRGRRDVQRESRNKVQIFCK